MNKLKQVGLFFGIIIASLGQGFCQTNLQFTTVTQTAEQAIQLSWASTNGEVYGVQYANALAGNPDGSTAWQTLYDNYPSQGTNTFVGDFGNFDVQPAIPHPKNSPMRFYQIVDEGADTAAAPFVTIASPASGGVLSGQITVLVVSTSSLPVLSTTLYVDGQQMNESDDGSNYVINTCEWLNGPHTLFAVATARSGMSGPSGSYPIYTGHAVSSYIPVTFSNLISEVAFSQPFFEPSLGETQEVTASFAASCDWTLQIQDQNSNVVRNASGSGTSVTFDWDGTGDGETNIADGVYYYVVSALTNSGSFFGSSMVSRAGLSSASVVDDALQWWATPSDGSGAAIPLALFPFIDTNNFVIFQASRSDVQPQRIQSQRISSFGAMSADSSDSSSYGGPSAQATTAPTRPVTAPVKNAAGTYGVAFFSWSSSQTVAIPKNGITYPLPGVCHLDGYTSSGIITGPIPEAPAFELNFVRTMSKNGWKIMYERDDSILHANDMRRSDKGYGGGELFTTANIGLFLDHGDYGTDPDYSPGSSGSKQTYFRCSSDSGDNGWLRMCQIGFGGNLKWMGILACNSLNTYSSMVNAGAIPLKTTHMVCGASTIVAVGEDLGALWAKKMFGGVFSSPETVVNAWFDAGRTQYSYGANLSGSTYIFRVAGYPECMNDTLKNNTAPYSPSSAPGNLTQISQQVYP